MKRTIIRIILSLVIIVVGFITYRIVSYPALEKYTVSNNGQSITNKSCRLSSKIDPHLR
jgi:CHASE3 domain sensor protein